MKVQQKLALAFIRTKLNVLSIISREKAAKTAFRLFCTPIQVKSKPVNEIFKHAEKLQFQLNGNNINGFRWNAGGKKKALLLHGFSSSCHNFYPFVQPLIHKGFEVLAFDAPAHG